LTRQQFVSLDVGLIDFFLYLEKRCGADIRTFRRMEEIERALEYVGNNCLEGPTVEEDAAEWFRRFERREDVVSAFVRFIEDRGLIVPQF